MTSDIQRDYERRYPGISSRWLAYCYAVGRHPTGMRPARSERPASWIGSHMARARAELGIATDALTEQQLAQCGDLLWRYAMEERG